MAVRVSIRGFGHVSNLAIAPSPPLTSRGYEIGAMTRRESDASTSRPSNPRWPLRDVTDTTRIYVTQALRAAAYEFGAVLLSTSLPDDGLASTDQ
jgi:hypothetical protein